MNSIRSLLLGFCVATSCLVSTTAAAKDVYVDEVPALREVTPGIFRSGRPYGKGVTRLQKQLGVRTIINLEDSESNVAKEKKTAESLGIEFHSFPMNAFKTPNDDQVAEILDLLADPSRQPVLVHCKHGEDRTGLIVGLHRVFENGWTPKTAYKEMISLGFHQILFKLDRYYKEKSGYKSRGFDSQIEYATRELSNE